MHKITYKESAELLGVEYITIKHAVMRGKLTRCSVPINQAMLLQEQVQLFKGRKGISTNNLTIEEKALWEEYKRIAEDQELLALAINPTSSTESIAMKMAKEAGKTGANIALVNVSELIKSILVENNLKVPEKLEAILEKANP